MISLITRRCKDMPVSRGAVGAALLSVDVGLPHVDIHGDLVLLLLGVCWCS